MKYSVSDKPLKLREFGRNLQQMVAYAKSLENKEDRTMVAEEIIKIMTYLNPSIRENPDYKQKLWDAIFAMADFDLDVEAPFPAPEAPEEEARPEHMGYYRGRPRFRQYGKNVEFMIAKATEMEEGPKREVYLNQIANTMKQFLRNMNRENTTDEAIMDHIRELSGGKLNVKLEDITFHKTTAAPPTQNKNRRSNNKSKRGRKKRKR